MDLRQNYRKEEDKRRIIAAIDEYAKQDLNNGFLNEVKEIAVYLTKKYGFSEDNGYIILAKNENERKILSMLTGKPSILMDLLRDIKNSKDPKIKAIWQVIEGIENLENQ